jgi:hypothetical protein
MSLLAAFGRHNNIELTDPKLVTSFATSAQSDLSTALQDDPFLHGLRVERMFEALVVSLGQFQMLKSEDNGHIHGRTDLRAPDFRVILTDGEQWLVETKNVYVSDPSKQKTRLSAIYMKSLLDYTALMRTSLRLAIYWARWGLWTLVSPDRFMSADGSLKLTMEAAICASELDRLGDVTIGTSPPLRLVLEANSAKPRSLSGGRASFVVAKVRLFSEHRELVDPDEQQLAFLLMRFGDWEMTGPRLLFQSDDLAGVEYRSEPVERSNPDEMFEMAGRVSRIFSRHFAEETVRDGNVVALATDPKPGWFSLLTRPYQAERPLPLWIFRFQPANPRV